MKLKTFGLALVATAFMASATLAQPGTMQPIPNPPEKAKVHHKKKKPKAAAEAAKTETKDAKADAKADAKDAKADAKADKKK